MHNEPDLLAAAQRNSYRDDRFSAAIRQFLGSDSGNGFGSDVSELSRGIDRSVRRAPARSQPVTGSLGRSITRDRAPSGAGATGREPRPARPRSARSARRPTYQGTPADYPGPPMPSYPITSASERGTQVFVSRYL
jgi:hypothetical protein